MTAENTLRHPAQSIQIGPRHGYRIDGDHAVINAELQLPPHHPGGEWSLELWAAEEPYREGPLTGIRIAEVALDLPTPIGPHVHRVDTRTPARLPLQGRAYSTVLALVHQGQGSTMNVHAFANYTEPQTFMAPHFSGAVGYEVQADEVVLQVEGIVNPRSRDNLSGTLSLELWAFPASGSSAEGLRLAASEIERVAGQRELPLIERRAAFSQPPEGRFQLALLLCEWTFAHGYVTRDRRDFACLYEQAPPESHVSAPVPAPVAVVAAARPVDRLRLVPAVAPEPTAAAPVAPEPTAAAPVASKPTAAAPVAPEPTAAAPVAPVSIQTGTVEQLSALPGLNLKLAKEVIKARPFSSVADLIRVRGIGRKILDRLKGLVTL